MGLRKSVQEATFSVREISDKAEQKDDVVRLDIGQPDFPTPPEVKQEIADKMTEYRITYTSLWGIPELREEIAAYESWKTSLSPENVIATTGGIGALSCILNGFLDPGDEVLMDDPAWMPYSLIGKVSPGDVRQVSFFQDGEVDAERVETVIDDNTELLLLNSPSNPEGRVYSEEDVRELGGIAEDNGLWIVSDEVYDHLLYGDAEHKSPAEFFPERTIIVNSMSKNFAMTGWRLGWVAASDEELIHELGKANRAFTACPNFLAQKGALTALRHSTGYVEEMVDAFEERRDLVARYLDELGWDYVTPQGAIYAFPDTGVESWRFSRELLEEKGVAVIPGAEAGDSSTTNIRICFGSVAEPEIREGFERIKDFVT